MEGGHIRSPTMAFHWPSVARATMSVWDLELLPFLGWGHRRWRDITRRDLLGTIGLHLGPSHGAILRWKGVPIGKRDFMGKPRVKG